MIVDITEKGKRRKEYLRFKDVVDMDTIDIRDFIALAAIEEFEEVDTQQYLEALDNSSRVKETLRRLFEAGYIEQV